MVATNFTIIWRRQREGESTWSVEVEVEGRRYYVSVERGRMARGMYGVRGFHWYGVVREVEGEAQYLFRDRVNKGTGLRWLLERAELIQWRKSEVLKAIQSQLWDLKPEEREVRREQLLQEWRNAGFLK